MQVREYTDPPCEKLLPDLAPELRGRVKTLVLDLDNVLVHKEWTRAKGWQVRWQGLRHSFTCAHVSKVTMCEQAM